ncbi:hypothetical protein V6767_20035 [Martelella sp. FLE1502]
MANDPLLMRDFPPVALNQVVGLASDNTPGRMSIETISNAIVTTGENAEAAAASAVAAAISGGSNVVPLTNVSGVNDIIATSPKSLTNGEMVFIPITATNTGPMRVSLDGGATFLKLLDNTLDDILAGLVTKDMYLLGVYDASKERIQALMFFNSEAAAAQYAAQTAADVITTNENVVITDANKVQTGLDRAAANTYKTQAYAAMIAAGLGEPVTSLPDPVPADGTKVLYAFSAGMWICEVVGGEWTYVTPVGKVEFGTVSELLSFPGPLGPEGTRIQADAFWYEVAEPSVSDHQITTLGGVKLYEIRTGGGGRFKWVDLLNPDGPSGNLLFRNPNAGPTRIHIEPNGHVASGTVAKLDLMLDPYDDDPTYYRILNFYTQVGDQAGTGEPGIAVINVKNVGNHWGTWTSMHFGFQDDSSTAVPLKLYLLDHTAPQHYTPHKGGWREGMAVAAGDHVTTLVAGVGRLYVAASTGTTGANVPSHGAGTVSDGGVSWTFVRSVSAGSVRPVVVIGDRDDMPILGFPDVRLQMHGDMLVKWGYDMYFLDPSNVKIGTLRSGGTGAGSEWLEMGIEGGGYTRWHKQLKFVQHVNLARCTSGSTAGDGDTTPDVTGIETLVLANSAATTITALDGGQPGQRVRLVANNGNTTIKHTSATSGGLIRNATGADIAMVTDGALDLERSLTANFWRVVGVGY